MTHFDLFSGYGGFTLALERAYGDNNIRPDELADSQRPEALHDTTDKLQQRECVDYTIIGFSEIDKYASAVLKYHWPNIKNYGDITKINWAEVPDFDLLTGGSPCQDLSIAGHRNGLKGERSGLFYEYMRCVKEKRPKYFIWENVKGALSSNKGLDFGAVINEMAEAGYSLWWQVLNAKDFGVPQNRERIFIVGFRDGSPREVFFERGDNQEIGSKVHPCIDAHYYKGHSNQRKMMDVSPMILAHYGHKDKPAVEMEISPMLKAQSHGHEPMIRDGRDNRSCLRAGRTPELGVTGKSIRRLTPVECERLMGLPDGWTKYGNFEDGKLYCDNCFEQEGKCNCDEDLVGYTKISDSQRYKLCGNGVVVNVVEEILKEIILK